MDVRILIGAQAAYACIKAPGRTLDVRLAPGMPAHRSLRESAEQLDAEATRLIERAGLMRAAADVLARPS